jgi:hypothetical protein
VLGRSPTACRLLVLLTQRVTEPFREISKLRGCTFDAVQIFSYCDVGCGAYATIRGVRNRTIEVLALSP